MSRRARFFAALGVFLAWVAALGYLAATSADKPRDRPPADASESRR